VGPRETLVALAYSEVDVHEVCGCTRSSGRESCGRDGIRAIGAVAVRSGERCEGRGIRPQLRDLKGNGRSALEQLFELEVSPCIVSLTAPRGAQRCEGVLPRCRVRAREGSHPILDCERLRRDSCRLLPRVARAPRDHRDKSCCERDGERGRRAAAGRVPPAGEALEEGVEPQFEVVLGVQSRTSLRRPQTPS
jgi:hypothetical protein